MSREYQRRIRGSNSQRRDKELTIRLTDEERQSVRTIAGGSGTNMADFVRRRLLDAGATVQMSEGRHLVKREKVSGVDPALMRQLAGIGSNLNQIARAVNRQALQSQTIQVIEVLAVLLVIERQISALCNATSSRFGDDHAH